ncbi:MAG TPA: copper transporter [Acidothermaceae bacterium]|jgi:hypothetical protein
MIDFKYHVVSIVAVFLALAVGIVLGTNVLSGDVLSNLKTQTSDLRKEAQALRDQNQQQQNRLSDDENFAQALEPAVVAGRLTGHHVVVVTVPNAPKSVRDAAVKTLTEAGATVTAQVDVTGSYADPAQADTLDELLKTVATPQFAPIPPDDVPAQAAAILAAALVGSAAAQHVETPPSTAMPTSSSASPDQTGPAKAGSTKTTAPPSAKPTPGATVTTAASERTAPSTSADPRYLDASSVEVLAGLAKAGFVKLDQQPALFADMAVVVTAAAPTKTATPTPTPDVALLDLIAALQRAGSQTVVVGPVGSADDGGVLAQLRGNDSLAKVVSSVDNADSASGRIAMVFALAGGDAVTGQYGTGQGAQAGLPTAALGVAPGQPSATGSAPPPRTAGP